jgi:hypothetical protein
MRDEDSRGRVLCCVVWQALRAEMASLQVMNRPLDVMLTDLIDRATQWADKARPILREVWIKSLYGEARVVQSVGIIPISPHQHHLIFYISPPIWSFLVGRCVPEHAPPVYRLQSTHEASLTPPPPPIVLVCRRGYSPSTCQWIRIALCRYFKETSPQSAHHSSAS